MNYNSIIDYGYNFSPIPHYCIIKTKADLLLIEQQAPLTEVGQI